MSVGWSVGNFCSSIELSYRALSAFLVAFAIVRIEDRSRLLQGMTAECCDLSFGAFRQCKPGNRRSAKVIEGHPDNARFCASLSSSGSTMMSWGADPREICDGDGFIAPAIGLPCRVFRALFLRCVYHAVRNASHLRVTTIMKLPRVSGVTDQHRASP